MNGNIYFDKKLIDDTFHVGDLLPVYGKRTNLLDYNAFHVLQGQYT